MHRAGHTVKKKCGVEAHQANKKKGKKTIKRENTYEGRTTHQFENRTTRTLLCPPFISTALAERPRPATHTALVGSNLPGGPGRTVGLNPNSSNGLGGLVAPSSLAAAFGAAAFSGAGAALGAALGSAALGSAALGAAALGAVSLLAPSVMSFTGALLRAAPPPTPPPLTEPINPPVGFHVRPPSAREAITLGRVRPSSRGRSRWPTAPATATAPAETTDAPPSAKDAMSKWGVERVGVDTEPDEMKQQGSVGWETGGELLGDEGYDGDV